MVKEGWGGWIRVEGVIRIARVRRDAGHQSAQAVPRPPGDRSDRHAAVAMCRFFLSFTRVDRVRVRFGVVRFALLLAVVLCWVDRHFYSWVLLLLLCLLRVAQ